jgi:HSP20 family molecular chaperone IbpA
MSQETCGTTTCIEEPRQETVHHVQPIQVTPRADVWEADDAFVLTIEMPGVSDAAADLTLERNVLTVRGLVKSQIADGLKPALGDCRPRQFERSFRLSDAIDGQHLEATAKDGILTVRMPKSQHAVARKISVRPA